MCCFECCSVGSRMRTSVVRPHIAHKSCCLITGYPLPLRSHYYFNSSLCFFHSLSFSLDILSHSFTSSSCIFLTPTPSCSSSLQYLYDICCFIPSRTSPSSSYWTLSEMATGPSVSQLGINKHLDISLLSPSLVLFCSVIFLQLFSSHKDSTSVSL